MSSKLMLILGMMAATYIPRLVPFFMVSAENLPYTVRRFLQFIPYTALGALIVPGVFTATPDMPLAALLGAGFAAAYGWYKGGIIIPVLGSILITFIALSKL